MQLTPAIDPDIGLAFESQRQLPGGSVEIVYACTGRRQPPGAGRFQSSFINGR
jgi:hypothetical protein